MPWLDLRFEAAPRRELAPARTPSELAYASLGWVLLILADIAVRIVGFAGLYRIVERCPTLGSVPEGMRRQRAQESVTAVDRARVYYFKHAWCLQRAAVAVCLSRLRGVRGEMVIGVMKVPFSAHAWVELDEEIVNDSPILRNRYQVIARC